MDLPKITKPRFNQKEMRYIKRKVLFDRQKITSKRFSPALIKKIIKSEMEEEKISNKIKYKLSNLIKTMFSSRPRLLLSKSFMKDINFIPPDSFLVWDGKLSDGKRLTRVKRDATGRVIGSKKSVGLKNSLGFFRADPIYEEDGRVKQFFKKADSSTTGILDNLLFIEPRAWKVINDQLLLLTYHSIFIISRTGQVRVVDNFHFDRPHDLDYLPRTGSLAIVCSGLDRIYLMDRTCGEITSEFNLIEYYPTALGIFSLKSGEKTNLTYFFPEEKPKIKTFYQKDNVQLVERQRANDLGVSTALQTTHCNAVRFLPEVSNINSFTLLVSLLNTKILDGAGNIDKERSGGKIIIFKRYFLDRSKIKRYISNELLKDYRLISSNQAYFELGEKIIQTHHFYCQHPQENDNRQQIIIKQRKNEEGFVYWTVDEHYIVVDHLYDPHSIQWLGKDIFVISNSSKATINFYELINRGNKNLTAMKIGEVLFDDNLDCSRFGDYNWIHCLSLSYIQDKRKKFMTKNFGENKVFLSVCDAPRRGIHILELTRKKRYFIRIPPNLVSYQVKMY